MSTITPQLRALVIERAQGRCEYCRMPSQLQIGGFEVDHVGPRSRGGTTVAENLALACPHCNNRKSDQIMSTDPVSGQQVALFNPREHLWYEHFRWSSERPFAIEGLTPSGRATVECLQLNHPEMVRIRRAFTALGVFDMTNG